MNRRFTTHKLLSNPTTSKQIIDKGDAIILLVEDYPCQSEDQAKAREAYYILNFNCLNKNIPGRTQKEWIDLHKNEYVEYHKHYRESNKEKIEKYGEEHKDETKQYKINNKEKVKEMKKLWYNENKDQINSRRRENAKIKIEQINIIN